MTEKTESCDVRSSSTLVLEHQLGSILVQSRHALHSKEVRIVDLSWSDTLVFEPIWSFCRELLLQVDCWLRA